MPGQFTYRSAILILLLGVFTYLYGLDSRFAPKNGDEYPYMHIVRMTSITGQWLPLQSEMEGIKNTKPPLLFWEGIASTNWGERWTLSALRWPSIIYTALTAIGLCLAVRRFTGKFQTGILASLVWLSFFATYRYGRPFLTDPPEVFWLSLPFMALLYWGKGAFDSRFIFPLFAGVCLGLALLAKSFAYCVPVCLALGLCYWRWRSWSIAAVLKRDFYKLIAIGILSLAIFSLWFVLDPYPQAVWNEFVLGENAGKFDARSSNYFLDLIRGGDSIWMLMLSTFANAGLFIAVLLSALRQVWRERRFLGWEEGVLVLLIAAFFLVFSLPSQRSGRYLLPVMPAFAALIAVYWNKLPLWGFRLALILQLLVLSALVWVGGNLQLSYSSENGISWRYPDIHWALMAVSMAVVLVGLARSKACKTSALASCFLCYCALTSSLAPLEGALGRYSDGTIASVTGREAWIPCDYRAKDEEYRLLLPGAQLHGYLAKDASDIAGLSNAYPLVAVQTPMGTTPVLCDGCQIVGQRMEMRARQSNQEIQEILRGHIGKVLFVTEYLISTPVNPASVVPKKDACR